MYKEYGPYTRKDGRQVIVIYDGEKTTSRSYPRVVMDAPPGTEVHHKDRNPRNNDPSNFEVLNKEDHIREHTNGPTKIEVVCSNCGNTFYQTLARFNSNERRGYSSTCSRSCGATRGGKASGVSRRNK